MRFYDDLGNDLTLWVNRLKSNIVKLKLERTLLEDKIVKLERRNKKLKKKVK